MLRPHTYSTLVLQEAQAAPWQEVTTVQQLLLQVPEAARLLGISASALYQRARKGEVQAVRIGRRVLVPLTEVQRLAQGDENRRMKGDPA